MPPPPPGWRYPARVVRALTWLFPVIRWRGPWRWLMRSTMDCFSTAKFRYPVRATPSSAIIRYSSMSPGGNPKSWSASVGKRRMSPPLLWEETGHQERQDVQTPSASADCTHLDSIVFWVFLLADGSCTPQPVGLSRVASGITLLGERRFGP
jgi:hypothetical protein